MSEEFILLIIALGQYSAKLTTLCFNAVKNFLKLRGEEVIEISRTQGLGREIKLEIEEENAIHRKRVERKLSYTKDVLKL